MYGPESSGKTTLAYHAMAEVQRAGGTAALIDAEHAFDPTYCKACCAPPPVSGTASMVGRLDRPHALLCNVMRASLGMPESFLVTGRSSTHGDGFWAHGCLCMSRELHMLH